MSRVVIHPNNQLSAVGQISPELQEWLDAQGLNRIPTLNKDATTEYLNNRGMPVFRNAVVTAIHSGELRSALYSGQRLVSEYDAVRWALSRFPRSEAADGA
jgi:hypothetical protein